MPVQFTSANALGQLLEQIDYDVNVVDHNTGDEVDDGFDGNIVFRDLEGKVIEIHRNAGVTTEFDPSMFFDKDTRNCHECRLFMYCNTEQANGSRVVNLNRIVPCTPCAITRQEPKTADDGKGILLFMAGAAQTPIHWRMAPNVADSVTPEQLLKRFSPLIGVADMGQYTAYLVRHPNKETPVVYFMFAVTAYIEARYHERV